MSLSGRAGSTKLRGRVDAGFEAPARVRLEGVAPFGKPVFVLVADETRGTLVLPRQDRVLDGAPPDRILEALAGVAVGGDELRTIVNGCGFGAQVPTDGRRFSNGWLAGSTADGMVYLRQDSGVWELAAAVRGRIAVTYADFTAHRPATVRVRTESDGRVTDLTLRISEVETNTTLDPRTFDIRPDLPATPIPLTLDELRRAGPLGGG
jgi:hypothetical protein